MRWSRSIAIALVVCHVPTDQAWAQAETPSALISGLVASGGGGTPLAGVVVEAHAVVRATNGQSSTVYAGLATTDGTGRYALTVSSGTYYLRTRAVSGHVRQAFSGVACASADCRSTSGTPVTVASGATATADFTLAVESSVSGYVRRTDLSPLVSTEVHVYSDTGSAVGRAVTDATGWYGLGGLPAGTYFLRAAPAESARTVVGALYGGGECAYGTEWPECRVLTGRGVVVPAATAVTGIDFSLRPTGSVAGTVRSAAGVLAGVTVVVDLGGTAVRSATTGTDGTYTITGVVPGVYRLRTESITTIGGVGYVNQWLGGVCVGCTGTPTSVTVTAGTPLTGQDFDLSAGGTIQGTYTCLVPTTAWLLGQVEVYDASARLVQSKDISCRTSAVEFAFVGLPPGTYYALARDRPFVPFRPGPQGGPLIDQLHGGGTCVTIDCDVRRGTPLVVTAGATTSGVDFVLRMGATITWSAYAPPLRVFDARGIEVAPVVRSSVYSPPQEAVGLPLGTYYATIGAAPYGREECLDCPVTMGTPLVITSLDQTVSLSGTDSATRYGSVSGVVRDAVGDAPLSAIRIDVFSSSGDLIGFATSDVSGRWAVDLPRAVVGVSSGVATYYARTRNTRGYVDTVFGRVNCTACEVQVGTPITVSLDTPVTGIDFRLARGGLVSGIVTDEHSAPIPGLVVAVSDTGGAVVARATSGANGAFETTVPEGTYIVRSDPVSGRVMTVFDGRPCPGGRCVDVGGSPVTSSVSSPSPAVTLALPACATMALTPSILASGSVGDPYRQRLTVSGGTAPFGYVISQGRLPVGLSLDGATGVLSGTPTASGQYTLRAAAIDATGCAVVRSYVLLVTQCSFVLAPSTATVGAAGGTVDITVSDSCGSETVSPGVDWVSVNAAATTGGRIRLDVSANGASTPRTAYITIGRRVFSLLQGATQSAVPFGAVDLPIDGSVVSGSIAAGGWALDDLGVARVRLYRDPLSGEAPGSSRILLGDAVFVRGARPDVAAVHASSPASDRAGWGFLILTNMLPNQGNGTFRLHAYAEDVEGHEVLLGSRTIVAANLSATAPFGAIDTPGQGETVGGASFVNFGWALTPQPKAIALDGSTIRVLIDGAPAGTVSYNFFRSDVSTLFPGLANSNGPVGYRVIDTTALSEGLHTISWSIEDNSGAVTEVGARYFTVSNSTDVQSASAKAFARLQMASVPVGVVEGPLVGRRVAATADFDSAALADRTVHLAPGGRVDMALEDTAPYVSPVCRATWSAYLNADGVLSDLPVGASLDPGGRFYWEPGPAFQGAFEFVLIRTNCLGASARTTLSVIISGSR